MRVQRERAVEPRARGRPVAEAAFDRAAMEELERVLRAEAERVPRPCESLAAASVPGERPGEDVVAVDRRALRARAPCQRDRVVKLDAVVDIEQRRLEVGADA